MKSIIELLKENKNEWKIPHPEENKDFMVIDIENKIINFLSSNDIKDRDVFNSSDDQDIFNHIKDLKFGESFSDQVSIWVRISEKEGKFPINK